MLLECGVIMVGGFYVRVKILAFVAAKGALDHLIGCCLALLRRYTYLKYLF